MKAGSTVSMSKAGSAPSVSLQYSTDNETWQDFTVGSTTITLPNVGDKVYFRAGANGNSQLGSSYSNYNSFKMTGKIAASGNIMSLLSQDFKELKTISATYCFCQLFYQCTSLSDTSKLVFPATTLSTACYGNMFTGCYYLLKGPKLLPAMTLANNCYYGMFADCFYISDTPELPATTLAESCYYSMFGNCSSITTAPELPATTLANNCYQNMFNNCSKLNNIKVAFIEWTSTNYWLNGVSSTGTFTCPAALPDERGTSRIPTGWTKVNL